MRAHSGCLEHSQRRTTSTVWWLLKVTADSRSSKIANCELGCGKSVGATTR